MAKASALHFAHKRIGVEMALNALADRGDPRGKRLMRGAAGRRDRAAGLT